jgi:molybdenum ABC transporter molybdate-binding protein
MLSRLSTPLLAFAGSALLLAGLIGALYCTSDHGHAHPGNEPLIVFCAEAMRLPLDAIARDYEREFHQKVDLHFGSSMSILATLELGQKGDLFLPADDSFIQLAKKKNLVDDVYNIAKMHAVVIVRPNFPRPIKTWDNFLAAGNKIGLGNTDATAIGMALKQHLQGIGLWDAVEKRDPKFMTNVNEVCNSVRLGSVDVGIVWDVIALPRPELTIVKLKELDGIQARVQVALAKSSKQPTNARRFINYLRAKDKGTPHLKRQGYSDIDEGDKMTNRPTLVIYAGAMLRPAVEVSLKEFEERENVDIKCIYNGCGILVSQMKAGQMPDVYFACDTSFMTQVKDEFEKPTSVSSNQLMIVTKKGNPKVNEVKQLLDLGQPGLRVGVGHEQQCALGALTKETFIRTGVYAQVTKNVVVQSATGDFLINQLRTGALDVVVGYRSNVEPFKDELDGIPITGIPCAAPQQPIAVSKSTTHPDLSRRLMEFLQTEESRARFEKMGFGWEVK